MTALHSSSPKSYGPNNGMLKLLHALDEPLGFEAGDANLYRYVGNQPTTQIDPSGQVPAIGLWYAAHGQTPEGEKARIIDAARKSFRQRANPADGWPNKDCERQAIDTFYDLKSEGPWKNWELKGVSGTRLNPKWPSGYRVPRILESENAIGVFPLPENPCQPFIIDPFHGYNNELQNPLFYDDTKDFFRKWYWNGSRDSWAPKEREILDPIPGGGGWFPM